MQKLYTFCAVGEDIVMLQEQKKILCRKEKLQEGRKGVELALTTQILLIWLSGVVVEKDRHSEQPIEGAFRFKSAQDEIQ